MTGGTAGQMARRTDGPTDQQTEGPTNRRNVGLTDSAGCRVMTMTKNLVFSILNQSKIMMESQAGTNAISNK